MSNTSSISQPAPAPTTPAAAQAQAFDPDASFTTLCNLRDPDQFKHVSIHDFPGEKTPEEMDALVDTIADGLKLQCGIPLERIGRVRHFFQPADLDDKVLVDIRHVSNPKVERVFVFYDRNAGVDKAPKDYA